jgi:hypothetical protein
MMTNRSFPSQFTRKCYDIISQLIIGNGAMRKYIILDFIQPTKQEILFHYYVLKIITAAFKYIDKTKYEDFRSVITPTFCNDMLSSTVPLHFKNMIFPFACELYNMELIDICKYTIIDLKAILYQMNNSNIGYASITHEIFYYLDNVVNWLFKATKMCQHVPPEEPEPTMIDSISANVFPYKAIPLSEPIDYIEDIHIKSYFEILRYIYGILRLTKCENIIKLYVEDKNKYEQILSLYGRACSLYSKVNWNIKELDEDTKLLGSQLHELRRALKVYRQNYEMELSKTFFLNTDGIPMYIDKISQYLLPIENTDFEIYTDNAIFERNMDYVPQMPEKILKNTSLMKFLSTTIQSTIEFLESGGSQFLATTQGNIKETFYLKQISDFTKWLYGGGRYLKELMEYLSEFGTPGQISKTFLDVLCLLLENEIDEIRQLKIPLEQRINMVQVEVTRIQRIQDAIGEFGVGNLVLNMVGRSCNNSLDDPLVLECVPQALKLGCMLLASGNDSVQEYFMINYKDSQLTSSPTNRKKFFVEAIRSIVRKIVDRISMYIKERDTTKMKFPLAYLKVLNKIFDFCGALCSGHNAQARNFLRDQDKSEVQYDIVLDIANSVNALLTLLTEEMHYITYSAFYEFLGPYTWKSNSDAKRKLVAWHDDRTDYVLMTELLFTLRSGFHSLTEMTQGPCLENQASGLKAVAQCPQLLEYLGALKLKTTSHVQGTWFGEREVLWDCGNPGEFYNAYARELRKLGRYSESGSQSDDIKKWCSQWEKTVGPFHKISETFDVLGVSIDLFQQLALSTESSCLRYILALLESTSELVTENICPIIDNAIMLQNMENVYKLSFQRSSFKKEDLTDITVSYLTLISTLASAQRENPLSILDDLLLEWKEQNAKQGFKTESLVASIEISTPDGSVQRVYFSIPKFVRIYWKYPEVQKAKELMLYAVSRESAEDKLSDFFTMSQSLVQVMKRQEKLRIFLTPVLHSFFGGYNKMLAQITPSFIKIRPMLFYLTMAFSILYAYLSYRSAHPWIIKSELYFE